jgi:hypothetical protein
LGDKTEILKPKNRSTTTIAKSITVVSTLLFILSGKAPGSFKARSALAAETAVLGGSSNSALELYQPLPDNSQATFSSLQLHSNIETIGVVVSGVNLPKTAELKYRQSGETSWRTGHPLIHIDDGRLVGSLFGVSPATTYQIKVSAGAAEINGSTVTQPDELVFTPSTILHVDDDANPGGDGSRVAPFRSIQEGLDHATPGTQVLVADGIYNEMLLFPRSGTPGNWIQVMAEGHNAILDGSYSLTGNVWTRYKSYANVWFIKLGGPIRYLARDQVNYYNYDDLTGLLNERGHNYIPVNEGWYLDRNSSTLYIRSLDNPTSHSWQLPRFNDGISSNGRDWLWIEGFEIRLFGTLYGGCGICMNNASHVVIRKNRIHNIFMGIYIGWTGNENQGNDTRIEFNEIFDPPVNEWPWAAVKGTTMEGTAIILRGHNGAIVRGNEIHHFFNGIYSGSSSAPENSALAFDVDVYDNHIHHIGDDALEPEGACINHRFRENIVDSTFVGISLAPITQGPVWVVRSLFTNYTANGIKWDRKSDGVVMIYHNTFWSSVQNSTAIGLISPVYNSVMRNNIFRSESYALYEVVTGSAGQDWNYDSWFTNRSPRYKWENKDYTSLSSLCTSTGLECNGHEEYPGISNPGIGDFTLNQTSPNIDRGVVIPTISDSYSGNAPDIGAYEYQSAADPAPTVSSILRNDDDPTSSPQVDFTVTFSEPVTGVDILPPFNDFRLSSSPEIIDANIFAVTPLSDTTYSVSINTGSGNGTLRLDLVDDNSISDAAGNLLGGVDIADGSYNSGEMYTVLRSAPSVTGILRADPSPTSADSITFLVTFSEEVFGVDGSDFSLKTTGELSGAYITNVSTSGNTFNVIVNTGNGDGGIRLDVLDDDSIRNASDFPLGGSGPGNGEFASGEAYMVDRTAPYVTGSWLTDTNPTSADSVSYSVVFSEPVIGVDASDFNLSATGSLSDASITNVSGSGYLYIVVASTGTGEGLLRLDILDNDSILDGAGLPLAGVGFDNGNFTSGAAYHVDKPVLTTVTETFRSNGRNDGWVLESSENSNRGGDRKSNTTTIFLGDNKQDRQYRAILDFPTSSLPDNAVITKALLMIKRAGQVGSYPFNTHKNILVDIRSVAFGFIGPYPYRGLQSMDFQSAASQDAVGVIQNNPFYDWYWVWLDSSSFRFINLYSTTQFRLRFEVDDNDDRGNDYLKFFSGDYRELSDRPQLVIEYYVGK